jgi:hypothetical protein
MYKIESKFVSADINDKDFEGKCPSDRSKLMEMDQEIPPTKCPRCNKDLVTKLSGLME